MHYNSTMQCTVIVGCGQSKRTKLGDTASATTFKQTTKAKKQRL